MVRAILAGQKTQTRRLASSPLAKLLPADQLWVREHWSTHPAFDGIAPRDLKRGSMIYTRADNEWHNNGDWIGAPFGKHRQGMHMPRWASRLTLVITDVRFEPVDQISEADAIAEGITCENMIVGSHCPGGRHSEITADRYFSPHLPDDEEGFEYAADAFAALWDSLHDQEGERFAEGPPIVALTFAATLANIDGPTP